MVDITYDFSPTPAPLESASSLENPSDHRLDLFIASSRWALHVVVVHVPDLVLVLVDAADGVVAISDAVVVTNVAVAVAVAAAFV